MKHIFQAASAFSVGWALYESFKSEPSIKQIGIALSLSILFFVFRQFAHEAKQ